MINQGESNKHAFIESNKHARKLAGLGTPTRHNYINYCYSGRTDKPYLTQNGTISNKTSANALDLIGKYAPNWTIANPFIERKRVGFTFAIAASYASGFDALLTINIKQFFNGMESYVPRIYVSNTTDNILYGTGSTTKPLYTWESNVNTLLQLDTGGDIVYGVTEPQVLRIPNALITARLNSFLSIIIGADKDLLNTGSDGSPGGIGGANAAAFYLKDSTIFIGEPRLFRNGIYLDIYE